MLACNVYFSSQRNVDGLIFTFLSFILDIAFALSVFGFIIMHFGMVSKNVTTIESFEEEERSNRNTRWRYDVGRRKNFEQVRSCRLVLKHACLNIFCFYPFHLVVK